MKKKIPLVYNINSNMSDFVNSSYSDSNDGEQDASFFSTDTSSGIW